MTRSSPRLPAYIEPCRYNEVQWGTFGPAAARHTSELIWVPALALAPEVEWKPVDRSQATNFGGYTVPVHGSAGWGYGTGRWSDGGVFIREVVDRAVYH